MRKQVKIISLGKTKTQEELLNVLRASGVFENINATLPEQKGGVLIIGTVPEKRPGLAVKQVSPILAEMGCLFEFVEAETAVARLQFTVNNKPRLSIEKIKSDLSTLRGETENIRHFGNTDDLEDAKETGMSMLLSLLCELGHDDAVADYLLIKQ